MPLVVGKAGLTGERYEAIEVDDPDNMCAVYETVNAHMQRIKAKFDTVVVDYTSGTKVMTAALVILAALYEADELKRQQPRFFGGLRNT